jgi:hypothetical protein
MDGVASHPTMNFGYCRHRIFLLALALGLSAVWFTEGLSIAWSEVPVNLPEAKSGDILFVYPIDVQHMRLGSSGCCGGIRGQKFVALEKEGREKNARLFFRLTKKTPFFPYYTENSDRHPGPISYYLECQSDGLSFVPQFGRTFKRPDLAPLKAGEYFTFSVNKPDLRGLCILSIGNYQDQSDKVFVPTLFFDQPFLKAHNLDSVAFQNE